MRKIRKRTEDQADQWLREHDPYYTSSNSRKREQLKYPYFTPDQEVSRSRKELPLSYLNQLNNDGNSMDQEDEEYLDYLNAIIF